MSRRAAAVEALAAEYAAATDHLNRLVTGLDEGLWQTRPQAGGWSMAECVEHLNITSATYLPLLRERIDALPTTPDAGDRPYRRALVGWLLCWMLEPPVRTRTRTPPRFEPQVVRPIAETTRTFAGLQQSIVGLLREGAGRRVALDRERVASPFNPRVSYSLWSAFRVLPVHERRHLWQAERVRRSIAP